ncbi:hypothetical protein FBU30_004564 [Linnemannia zychae]|nr:hypothetical protein FBU30_004564 [Linnemannia zychae]
MTNSSKLLYTPFGTIQESQRFSWIIRSKQTFPIEGPFFIQSGHLFKPLLKRQSGNDPIDLEIKLMSHMDVQTPLQLSLTVESKAPPGEKSLSHSLQRRSTVLSSSNRAIEFKTIVMPNRWDASLGLCVEITFNPIKRNPCYDWLWSSDATKDVEIRFLDSEEPPIRVHKDFVLHICPQFITLVEVVMPSSTDSDSDSMISWSQRYSSAPRVSHPGSPSLILSPELEQKTSMTGLQSHQSRFSSEPEIISLKSSSDASSRLSVTRSLVITNDQSQSSSEDVSVLGSECGNSRSSRSSTSSAQDIMLNAEERQIVVPIPHAQSNQSPSAVQNKETVNRRKRRHAKRQDSEAFDMIPSVELESGSEDTSKSSRETTPSQLEQQQQKEKKREKSLYLSLTHNNDNNSRFTHPCINQCPPNEIWRWSSKFPPNVCKILMRYFYFEEIPSNSASKAFKMDIIETYLRIFEILNLSLAFQSFLQAQIALIENDPNPNTYFEAPELALKGGMCHQFIRPVLVKSAGDRLEKIIKSIWFSELHKKSDPAGILPEAIMNQTSSRQ